MTANIPNDSQRHSEPESESSDLDLAIAELLRSLRRKEGTWVEWGQACQTLQKAGLSLQQIFEETGFEPIHQNQITVAAQVYQSLVNEEVSEAVRSRFETTGSDTLYELRILSQADRATAATLIVEKGVDSEGAREVAKAIKEFSWRSAPPEGFTDAAGDAVAHHYWKLARQQADLQSRSRLIALALQFVASSEARQQIEKLLTDFTVARAQTAPLLPTHRPDSEEELPRIVPLAGRLPMTAADLKVVPLVEDEQPFGMVRFTGEGVWVPVPGWQVVLNAEDLVALLVSSDRLPNNTSPAVEEVLVLVDRAQRQWNSNSYFLVDQGEELALQWAEHQPELPILGQVLVVIRPKRILDEEFTKDPWHMDE